METLDNFGKIMALMPGGSLKKILQGLTVFLNQVQVPFVEASNLAKAAKQEWETTHPQRKDSAYEKWLRLSKKEIDNAEDPHQAAIAYRGAPEELKPLAFSKWDNLSVIKMRGAENQMEIQTAIAESPDCFGSLSRAEGRRVWDELSLDAVQNANSSFEIALACYLSRRDSEASELALNKFEKLVDQKVTIT